MDEDGIQKELFELEKPKKPFARFTGILPKADLDGRVSVTLSLEKIVFISIAVIMVMIMVFAIGVETGKARRLPRPAVSVPQNLPRPPVAAGRSPGAVVPALTGTQAGGPAAGVSAKGFFSTTPATDAKAARAAGAITKGAAVSDRSKPYTIIVGTFSKKETAQAASAYLMKEGFQASVSYIQPYYRVTVGSYADQDGPSVQKDLARVRRVYKNASIGQK